MNNFIQIKPDSLVRHRSGKITGIIFISIDSFIYPEDTWDDFVVIILNQWTTAFLNAVQSNHTTCKWYFMDGPFSLHIDISYRNKIIYLSHVEGSKSISNKKIGAIAIVDLLKNIEDILFLLDAFFVSHAYISDNDFSSLKKNFHMLSNIIK